MARRLIWIDEKELSGWGCADCGWVLSNQSDLPVGQELRMQFADHNCEQYPRKNEKGHSVNPVARDADPAVEGRTCGGVNALSSLHELEHADGLEFLRPH